MIFENQTAATSIFRNWKQELGDRDVNDRLRVSIIRRICAKNPGHYRVLIGANIGKHDFAAKTKAVGTMQRINTMTASTSRNLDQFLVTYSQHQEYNLVPAIVTESGEPGFDPRLAIVKQELIVKDAWEVGLNDMDMMGIQPNDDVFVPDGIENPPINDVLKRFGLQPNGRVDKAELAKARKKRNKKLAKKRKGKK